ncbi:hypothetical protein [Terrarubrum flagellatum]|uniref:hypothetical protein n=1 Tax=Terrirubrum flagellatum TaxID=2895980 RepID=UPI00314546F7
MSNFETPAPNALPVGELGNQMVMLPYRPAAMIIASEPAPVAVAQPKPRRFQALSISLIAAAALSFGGASAHAMRSILG